MKTTKPLIVHRNGIKLFNKFFYSTPLMVFWAVKSLLGMILTKSIRYMFTIKKMTPSFVLLIAENITAGHLRMPGILDGTAGVRDIIEEMGKQL